MKKHEIAKLFRKYLLAPPRCMFCGSERCTQEIPLCKTCFDKYVSAALDGCDDCGALPINCHCFAVKNCAAHYWLFNYNKAEIKDMVNALKRSRDIHTFTFLAARLADAIYTECCLNKDYIDAETVANMLLLQVRRDNKNREN